MYLVVNGLLSFAEDLNMETFHEKIEKLEVNGKISLYENQESFLYKKVASLASCHLEVIPEGYELVAKPLRLNPVPSAVLKIRSYLRRSRLFLMRM